jgi:hypothetical protein
VLSAIALSVLAAIAMSTSSQVAPVAGPGDATAATGVASAVGDAAIDWRTDHVEVRADALRLTLGDRTLTTAGSKVRVHEWVQDGDHVEVRARWFEAGASHDLYLGFQPVGRRWAMTDIRYLQGAPGVRQLGAPTSPLDFAVADADRAAADGATGEGTFRVAATVPAYSCEGSPSPPTEVVLELDGLQIEVRPPEWTIFDDLRRLVGRGPRPRADWLGLGGYRGPPTAVACAPSVAATLEREPDVRTDPAATDALADLVTEEVEPGVLRVLGDRIRNLLRQPLVSCRSLLLRWEDRSDGARPTRPTFDAMSRGKVVAGLDGGIWLFWHDRFVRLGQEQSYDWAEGQWPSPEDDIEVAPDGTIWHAPASGSGRAGLDRDRDWAAEYLDMLGVDADAFAERPECLADTGWMSGGDGALRVFRDGAWEVALEAPNEAIRQVELGPDGTVWTAWHESTRNQRVGPQVARLGAGGWRLLAVDNDRAGAPRALSVQHDGTPLLQTGRGRPSALWRRVGSSDPGGGDWQALDAGRDFDDMVTSPGGVIWGRSGPNAISRLDAEGWREWDLAQSSEPDAPRFLGGGGPRAAGHDGSVWVKARRSKADRGCHGIYNFDGSTWTQSLDGHCIHSLDVAPDGWLWLLASPDRARRGDGSADLYAIGPDAPAKQRADA